jgi:guanine deaminase
MTSRIRAYRAALFHFVDDPLVAGDRAWHYIEDGLLIVEDGLITACGDYATIRCQLPQNASLVDYRPALIMPGFIDSHVHYVQTDMVASPAPGLLDWLERYTFPAEQAFADPEHARALASFFLDQMLCHGSTSAMVFASSHAVSVDALFEAALERGMRLIAGKVMMDRNAPDGLRDDTVAGYEQTQALIARWHGRERLSYAVTPRFAPTSSDEQLQQAGDLFRHTPGVYLQSHVAENASEVEWVRKLYPASRSYLDVYERFGLLGERAIYAHGIHLDDTDRQRMAQTGTALAFCPSSNLFLGSGLLDVAATARQGVALVLGSDVGAGPSLDMFRVMQDAHSVLQLRGGGLDPLYPLYLATLGAARGLRLDDRIGSLQAGREADFFVLDASADEWLARRITRSESVAEMLFAAMLLGSQRCIRATYCAGEKRYDREAESPTT